MTETNQGDHTKLKIEIDLHWLKGHLCHWGYTNEQAADFIAHYRPTMEMRAREAVFNVIKDEFAGWMRGRHPAECGGRGLPPEEADE